MSSTTRVGTVIEEKFRLDEKIGEGSMGAVYRGTQLMVDRAVAVKLLHPGFAGHDKIQARFEVEARAIARLNHPNCITLYDFGYSEQMEAFYTVVEYIDGIPLEALTSRRPPLERIVDLIQQTASALAHAHHHGILHRDLKPENIMVAEMTDGSEMVKVLDFGIAQIMQGPAEDETDDFETDRLTKVGEVFGTPPYMSPEQSRSTHDLTPATDLYSLGIIFYELLEGRLPFMADTPVEVMTMHRQEQPPPLSRPGIPDAIESLVFQMLSKDPHQRPDSGNDIVQALEAIPDEQLQVGPAPGTDSDYEAEPTRITEPRPSDRVQTDSTLMSAPPETDAVAAADKSTEISAAHSPAVGEESEIYELSKLAAPPENQTDDSSDHAPQTARVDDGATSTVERPSIEPKSHKATQHLSDGEDPEVDDLASRLAGYQFRMIAGVVVTTFVVLAALAWFVLEFDPFSFADEEGMQHVADYAAITDDPADGGDDAEGTVQGDLDSISDDDEDRDIPRQVAVSADEDDETDDDDEDTSDETPDEEDETDDEASSDEQQPTDAPEPAAAPSQPASEPSPRQPPRLDAVDESRQDDQEQQGPPRLDL